MKILKYGLSAFISVFLLSGCSSKSSENKTNNSNNNQIATISEEEAFKYEKKYLAEYEKIKEQNKNFESPFKWIQPKNKKEQCKVYVGINPNDDKTLKSDYVLYWDGECKEGYASGLGREIEKTMLTELYQIGFYEGGKPIDYCTNSRPLEGIQCDGECSYSSSKPNHYVKTTINDKQGELEIIYRMGVTMSKNTPMMIVDTSPFISVMEYQKTYPNFGYIFENFRNDEFDTKNLQFHMRTRQNDKISENGFGFVSLKQGGINAGEVVNDSLVRRVQLPQSYFNNVDNIYKEIVTHVNIALDAQKKALIIKEKYKNKICQDSIKVSFMDNKEYKDICNEEKKNVELNKKINDKLIQIEQQKQAKRAQINQERLIQAQEMNNMINMSNNTTNQMNQMNQMNQLRELNFNQQRQNFNQNLQMQQLNNSIIYNNTMRGIKNGF